MAQPNNVKTVGRFLAVGATNTLLDFGALFFFTNVGLNVWLANTLSTSIALTFSFFTNRRFTFRSSERSVKQLLVFLTVTLFGLWVLQPLVIMWVGMFFSEEVMSKNLALLIGKILATGVTLAWNFVLYKQVVFVDSAAKRVGQ